MKQIKNLLLLCVWLLISIPALIFIVLGFITKVLINAFIKGMWLVDKDEDEESVK